MSDQSVVASPRFSRGAVRFGDGYIFWGYGETGSEKWVSLEVFAQRQRSMAVSRRKHELKNLVKAAELEASRTTVYRRGDVREADGYVFLQYASPQCGGGELWFSPQKFAETVAKETATRRAYLKNPEKAANIKNAIARWTRENPERVKQFQRASYIRNPGANARRARRLKAATPPDVNLAFVDQFYLTSQRLTECTGIRFEVDHVRPIMRGGLHHETNLQVVPRRVNRAKRDKHEAAWSGAFQQAA